MKDNCVDYILNNKCQKNCLDCKVDVIFHRKEKLR
jgi:hypothetical protein